MVSIEENSDLCGASRPLKKLSHTSNDDLNSDSNSNDDDSQVIRMNPIRPNLRWKDSGFQAQTMEALNQMRKNRHFCDVTLQIGQQDIPAHRVVLAAASPYLMELFAREDGGFRPSRKEVFELDGGIFYEMNGGFQKEALERLVDYAYTAQLEVPGDEVKAVYMASLRLRMDRVTAECARFLLSQLDLASCLDLRSMPGVAPEPFSIPEVDIALNNANSKIPKISNPWNEDGENDVDSPESNNRKKVDLLAKVDEFIETNLDQLGETRQLRSLPRICFELLHLSKEERDAAQLPRPLCELALDWARNQWLEDETLNLEKLARKRHLLYMPSDGSNTLKDCRTIEQGSVNDSDVVEDYRKLVNSSKYGSPQASTVKKRPRKAKMIDRGSGMNGSTNGYNASNGPPENRPSKPRELLYSRHINQNDHAKQADANESGWKVIACRRLASERDELSRETPCTKQGILAIVSIDRHLATFSIVQRVNQPSTPPHMINSTSSNDLRKSVVNGNNATLSSENGDSNPLKVNGAHPPYSPSKTSREGSVDEEDLVYASVLPMSQGKCGVGAESFEGKLIICGGYDRGECLSAVEMFDATNNSWSSMKPMNSKRGRFGLVKIWKDGVETLYAVAGSNGQMEESSVEKYDANGNWSQVVDLPVAMSNIGVCSLDNRMYCIGGTYGPSGTKYCFRLNETDSKWDRISNLQQGRFQAAVASYQGRIWVVGGCDAWNPLRSVEIYDPANNTWTSGPSLSSPRRGCGLAVRKGQLLVVGGSDGTHSLCTTEILDMQENVWKPGPTMTTCRANVAVAAVEDRLWAVGGFSGKIFLNTIEQLDPVSDEWTTFVTVPERSLKSNKLLSADIQVAERESNGQLQRCMDENNHEEVIISEKTDVIAHDEETLFEMESEPATNTQLDKETSGMEPSSPLKDIVVIQQSNENTLQTSSKFSISSNGEEMRSNQTEAVSKHVISTNLDNVTPSIILTLDDTLRNLDENMEELGIRGHSDGTEV